MKFQSKIKKNFHLTFFLLVFLPIASGFFLLTFFKKFSKKISVNPTHITSEINVKNPVFRPIFNKVVLHGNKKRNEIALSFDADMTPFMKKELETGKVKAFYNKKIIDILEEQQVPATIFIAGLWAEAYPQVTKELSQNPLFEIGNHSYSHFAFSLPCFNLFPINNKLKDEEFSKSQETLKKITGNYPKLFRFPGGCYQESDLALANKYGLTVVHWDVNGRDAFNQEVSKIISSVERETKPGSILVFHLHGDKNAPRTADALPEIITNLREKGFIFIKVSDLISQI